MRKSKPRFDLLKMIEWTAAIAFACALLAGSGGKTSWTTSFNSLPEDDSSLLTWLEQQDRQDVKVVRGDNAITLEINTGFFSDFEDLPKPPWPELGYPTPQGMGGSFSWTLFSGSPYLWIVGFGILILLNHVRKRYVERRL